MTTKKKPKRRTRRSASKKRNPKALQKILSQEEVSELLLLEDLIDKKSYDNSVYTKICNFYMVNKSINLT